MNAPRVNQATLARTLGVSRQAIHDLIKRQILRPDEAGLFDVDQARTVITERVRPSGKAASAAAQGMGAVAPNTAAAASAPPAQPPAQDQQLSYHVAKTLREAAEAKMAQLKLAEMQRKLIQAEPTLSAIYTAFRPLRDQCMLVGRKVAPAVAAMTDRREVQLAVERAMAEIFDAYVRVTLPQLVATVHGAPRDLPPEVAAPALPVAEGQVPAP